MGTKQHRPSVLIVEDTNAIRELLTEFLRRDGFEVAAFATAEEILADWPDLRATAALLITDLTLNGESGVHLIERLRVDLPQLPAIVISGSVVPQERLPVNSEFLEKPVAIQHLLDRVRKLTTRAA